MFMELELTKRTQNNNTERAYFEIKDYKVLIGTGNNLLLIQEGQMNIEDETVKISDDFLEIFKVQFIASCTTELEGEITVAFYIGEYSSLNGYVLDGLPNNYYQDGDNFRLVDYKSYLEICEMTGEIKLSLVDYINEIRTSGIGANTLLHHNGKFLNYDMQQALYKEMDSKNVTAN
jgi:hypothetical protein